MNIAYTDDSGSNDLCPIALYGAILLPDDAVRSMEGLVALTAANLVPRERRDEFEEFHAYDLVKGIGAFADIDEGARFEAIEHLLSYAELHAVAFVYSAVSRVAFRQQPVVNADPLSFAFRMCLLGVEDIHRDEAYRAYRKDKTHVDTLCLFIVDDMQNKQRKQQLRTAYDGVRQRMGANPNPDRRLWHAHDSMLFADSFESIGLQMADLCAFFTLGHLQQTHHEHDRFFDLFKSRVVCAKPEPEWAKYQHLLLEHV